MSPEMIAFHCFKRALVCTACSSKFTLQKADSFFPHLIHLMGENVKLVPLLMRTLSQMKSVHLSAQTYRLKHDYIANPIMGLDAEHLFIYSIYCYLLIIRVYNLLLFSKCVVRYSNVSWILHVVNSDHKCTRTKPREEVFLLRFQMNQC